MIAGLLLIYKACYNLVPRVFPIRPLEMSVTHEVGLVDPTKVGKMSSLIGKCKTTHRTKHRASSQRSLHRPTL